MAKRQQAGQGGVAAEGHFTARREPTQQPLVLLLQQESRLRLLQAARQSLHPARGGRLGKQHHRRAIAAAGALAEGLDQHRPVQGSTSALRSRCIKL